MNERIIAPPGFVQIEAVFFNLSVKGNKALVVHSRLATLVSCISCKIKHVPNVSRPHERISFKASEHVLMIDCLILLCVISSSWVLTVKVRHSLASVLRITKASVRINHVEKSHPDIIEEKPRNIPAQIKVPADCICNVCHLIERSAHCITCKCCKSCIIHLMTKVVELSVVIKHICLVLGGYCYLIGYTPADN